MKLLNDDARSVKIGSVYKCIADSWPISQKVEIGSSYYRHGNSIIKDQIFLILSHSSTNTDVATWQVIDHHFSIFFENEIWDLYIRVDVDENDYFDELFEFIC